LIICLAIEFPDFASPMDLNDVPVYGGEMSQITRILGIAGSLRRESYNRAALRTATQLVPQDTTLDTFELDGIPGFNQDEEKTRQPKWWS
jgi:hypothetical protein